MTICFISEEWPGINDIGGIGFHFENLAKYLSEHNHKILVLYNGWEQIKISNNYQIIGAKTIFKNKIAKFLYYRFPFGIIRKILLWVAPELSSTLEWNIFAMLSLFKLNKEHKIDIVETHEYHSTPVLLIVQKFAPLVISFHGNKKVVTKLNQEWAGLQTKLLHWLEKKLVKKSNYHYANSLSTAKLSSQDFELEISNVIYNAVDSDFFYPKNIETKSKYILYVGRLEKRKGIELLVKEYAALHKKNKENKIPQLYFVGRETYQFPSSDQTFNKYILENYEERIANKIKIISYQNRKGLRKYYQNALFCIFPSLYEPFGNVIAEALSCNKAVATTYGGGAEEILSHQQNIYFFTYDSTELGNTLHKLTNNEQLRKKIANNARKAICKHCSLQIIGEKTLAFYAKVIKEHPN